MDTFTWKDVISNYPSINILLNHENLFIFYFLFYEDKDTNIYCDCVQEGFMERDLIQQDSRDARMRLRKFSEQSCMVPNVGNFC